MSIKDKLQIILITYNRAKHVQKTLEQIFYEGSPVLDCEFVVQDNNSTDNTREIVEEWQRKFPNIKYVKNRYNIGLSGNIAKAMEVADKAYLWTISDDDKIDLSNWGELETAINNGEELIFVARYCLDENNKDKPAYWLLQATFIPGFIIKTSLFDDDTIKNAFDNIYTLFPHLCPILKFINDNKKPYILSKYIVDAGANHNLCAKDWSYIRGSNPENIYDRTKYMSWIVGYANIISIIKNEELKYDVMKCALQLIHNCEAKFITDIKNLYYNEKLSFMLLDVYLQLYPSLQKKINKFINWNWLIKSKYYPLWYKKFRKIVILILRKLKIRN